MAQAELFWALLEGAHPVKDLKKVNMEGFDWSRRGGKTALVMCIEAALEQPKERFLDSLTSIEWLIRSGASLTQKCTGGSYELFLEGGEDSALEVACSGHSAISYVQAWQAKLKDLKEWKNEFNFLRQVMSRFADASHSLTDPLVRRRVSIDEGIAKLGEKSLEAKDSHDLTIETADGLVTAHAHMLKGASSVVAAMLESPMKEGKAKHIEIKDTSSKAASLFLEMLGRANYSRYQ